MVEAWVFAHTIQSVAIAEVFPMADISSHSGWLGVRPNPASWFSLLRQHETKTLGPVAIVELRAYHSASDVCDGVGTGFETLESFHTIASLLELAECNASDKLAQLLMASILKPGRAFALATRRAPRRNTKRERREVHRLSSKVPYVARRKHTCLEIVPR